MKTVKFEYKGNVGEGVLEGDIIRRAGALRIGPADKVPFTLSSLPASEIAHRTSGGEEVPLSLVSLAVPFDPLCKIICAGVNYRDHAGEIGSNEPANPIIFTRSIDTLVPHGQPIVRPKLSETFDYEGEIAVVIGRAGRHISVDDAMGYVAGYTCFMDGSVREYQRHAVTTGKNFWRSGSMGPWVVTPDEVGDADLALQTVLNGEVVQSSSASRMIFGIRELIAYCSRMTWLQPGDVIATGTPGGVGSRRTPPLWMKAGDTVSVQVEKVGTLVNTVVDEEP